MTIVKIERPAVLNALRSQTLVELQSTLDDFASDKKSSGLVLTGSGDRAFSAGGDIRAMEKMNSAEARAFAAKAHSVVSRILGCPKPIFAAVNGVAFGAGCDLAICCDIRIAVREAKFGYPSLKLGVISPFAGAQILPHIIGHLRAKDLLLTGVTLNSEEAARLGLVTRVVERSMLIDETKEIARKMQDESPVALRFEKRLLNNEILNSMKKGNVLETQFYAQCFKAPDRKEGIKAFLEGRKPSFSP